MMFGGYDSGTESHKYNTSTLGYVSYACCPHPRASGLASFELRRFIRSLPVRFRMFVRTRYRLSDIDVFRSYRWYNDFRPEHDFVSVPIADSFGVCSLRRQQVYVDLRQRRRWKRKRFVQLIA